jgi:hypothetical protein
MHDDKRSFVFLILFLLLLASSCKVGKKPQKDDDLVVDANSNVLIYIQQGQCKGKCPVYEATFYSGKRMTYSGISRMPVLGSYVYLIPDELTKNLIFEAVKQNIKLIPDSIPVPEGAAKIKLHVVVNGKMKKMVGSLQSGNEAFSKYVKLLHAEVQAMIMEQEGKPWTTSPPEK